MKGIKMVMVATITIILLAALFVPILNEYVPHSAPLGWTYDDYRDAEGVTDASGSIELIEVDGKNYIHAVDVGEGAITYSNGYIENVTVSKAPLDLVFMYGQSNAAYRNAVPSDADPVPNLGMAYYFGLEDRSGPTAAENNTGMDLDSCEFWSMLDEDGVCRIGDKAPAFSATYSEITGHKVYWVCGAIGNKSLSTFLPTTGFMWEYGKDALTKAIDLVDTDKFDLSITYYIWCQGEANATSTVDSYKSQFLKLHNAMLGGEMGVSFKGCFISVVRDANAGNASVAQRELIAENSTIHLGADITQSFTVANGLMGSDDLHYSQAGNNLIGKTIGENMGDYVIGPMASVAPQSLMLLYAIPALIIVALIVMAYRSYTSRQE